MKKLTFFRSYQGSFSLTKEDSLFNLQAVYPLQVPVTIELGFSAPVDKDSGMSASLPLMNQLWSQAHEKILSQDFSSVLELYDFLYSFFKANAQEFSVLKFKFYNFGLWQELDCWYFHVDVEKTFRLPEFASSDFISFSQWQFKFSNKNAFLSFLKLDYHHFFQQLTKKEACEKPFELHEKLEKIAFKLPTSEAVIYIEKPL